MQPPNLQELIPPQAEQYIRRLATALTDAEGKLDVLLGRKLLSQDDAHNLYSAPVIRNALQANGVAPLNVANLPGILSQPQIPAVSAYNPNTAQTGGLYVSSSGALVTSTGVNNQTSQPIRASSVLSVYTQATLPVLASGDVGLQVYCSDYSHLLTWTGTAWSFGGDMPGRIEIFGVDPTPTTGWQLCDGTVVLYLQSDGTTASYTTPNLVANPSYLKLGASVSPITAPVNTGTKVTGITLPTTDVDSGPGTVVAAGVGTTVAAHTHTHTITTAITDPGHFHTPGEPQSIVFRPWFRR